MTETKNKTFNGKLLAAMQDMSNPKKDTNAYKYKYAQLDQVLNIVRPALQAQGMEISWRQREATYKFIEDGTTKERTCWFQELWVFDENEERLMDTRFIDAHQGIQERGSEETYLRRYALQSVFALAAEDDDGASAQEAKKARQKPKKAAQKPKEQPAEEDIDKRIENGVKAVVKVSGLDEENIYKILRRIATPRERLEWLEKTYKENVADEPME